MTKAKVFQKPKNEPESVQRPFVDWQKWVDAIQKLIAETGGVVRLPRFKIATSLSMSYFPLWPSFPDMIERAVYWKKHCDKIAAQKAHAEMQQSIQAESLAASSGLSVEAEKAFQESIANIHLVDFV